MISGMLVGFFMWLNRLMRETPHPWNEKGEAGGQLPYAAYELRYAPNVFCEFEALFDPKNRTHRSLKNWAAAGAAPHFFQWLSGKRVCDFACGGGGKSVFLAEQGASAVTGLDVEKDFIEQAKRLAQQKAVSDRCTFLQRDVRQSELPENSFDAVFMNDAIDHIPEPERALREALRILKPGGLLLINFESYFYFWGHHLWDAIRIPWLHLFTTEKFRIKLYKKAVEQLPNAEKRISFRIGRDEQGHERITYLNRLTIRRFHTLIERLRREGLIDDIREHQKTLRRFPLGHLGRIPVIGELFLSTLLCVVLKQGSNVRTHIKNS